jgi:hypothetical protein
MWICDLRNFFPDRPPLFLCKVLAFLFVICCTFRRIVSLYSLVSKKIALLDGNQSRLVCTDKFRVFSPPPVVYCTVHISEVNMIV